MLCMQTIQPRAYHFTVSFPQEEKNSYLFGAENEKGNGRGKQGGTRGEASWGVEGITSCMRVTLG